MHVDGWLGLGCGTKKTTTGKFDTYSISVYHTSPLNSLVSFNFYPSLTKSFYVSSTHIL